MKKKKIIIDFMGCVVFSKRKRKRNVTILGLKQLQKDGYTVEIRNIGTLNGVKEPYQVLDLIKYLDKK